MNREGMHSIRILEFCESSSKCPWISRQLEEIQEELPQMEERVMTSMKEEARPLFCFCIFTLAAVFGVLLHCFNVAFIIARIVLSVFLYRQPVIPDFGRVHRNMVLNP